MLPDEVGDHLVEDAQGTGRSLVGLLDRRDPGLQNLLQLSDFLADGRLGEARDVVLIPARHRYTLPDEVTPDAGRDALKNSLLPDGGASMRVVRAPDRHDPEETFAGPAEALP